MHIQQLIDQKQSKLDPRISIITPEDNVPAEVQTKWMTKPLEEVYVEHGVTNNPSKLKADIEAGVIKPFFAVRNDEPVAVAALIKNEDGSQELGRAASLERGSGAGSLLMLKAGLDHFSQNDKPLVTEVRVSAHFEGIPDGMASQTTCFDHLGQIPHALAPEFSHGKPKRNEQFAISSSQEVEIKEKLYLPDDSAAIEMIVSMVLPFVGSNLLSKMVGLDGSSHQVESWEFVEGAPFGQVAPGGLNSSLESAIKKSEEQHTFTLIQLEMSPNMMGAVIGCMNAGFIPCGVDRNPGENGHPLLMLGRLRKGTLLAPMLLKAGSVERSRARAMHRVDFEFRKSLRKSI